MEILFSEIFKESIRKHSSIGKAIKKKVDMIIDNPFDLGEPLKGNFRGYYSCPVKKNFLIIYLYCKICRAKDDDKSVLCHDCDLCEDETLKFIDIGPHDAVYKGQHKGTGA